MATYEEPLPAWLEAELRAQALGPRPVVQAPKQPKREPSKAAYGRGEDCPY
jgi:hypothetical protein